MIARKPALSGAGTVAIATLVTINCGSDMANLPPQSAPAAGTQVTVTWVHTQFGQPTPQGAVAWGHDKDNNVDLYVCRAPPHNAGGVYTGKLFAGHCNIPYMGKEDVIDDYEVMTSNVLGPFVWGNAGMTPIGNGYVSGHTENNIPIVPCMAPYNTGIFGQNMHGYQTGSGVQNCCHFGWGGDEKMECENWQFMCAQNCTPARSWQIGPIGGGPCPNGQIQCLCGAQSAGYPIACVDTGHCFCP